MPLQCSLALTQPTDKPLRNPTPIRQSDDNTGDTGGRDEGEDSGMIVDHNAENNDKVVVDDDGMNRFGVL